MKHRRILTFFVTFLLTTIIPDSNAALVRHPEKNRAPFPEYMGSAQDRNQFPCNARLRLKGLYFIEQTNSWGIASIVRIPFDSPDGKGRFNAHSVVVYTAMVDNVAAGGSYSTDKNIIRSFSTSYGEGKCRGEMTLYVDGKYWHCRDYPLE